MKKIFLLIVFLLFFAGSSSAQLSTSGAGAGFGSDPEFDDATFQLLLWLKGDTGTWQDAGRTTPAVDGQVVRAWDDQSGNGYHFTQATAAVGRIAGGNDGLLVSHVKNNAFGGAQIMSLLSGNTATLDRAHTDPMTLFVSYSVTSATSYNGLLSKDGGFGWDFDAMSNGGGAGRVGLFMCGSGCGNPIRRFAYAGAYSAATRQEVWVRYPGDSIAANMQVRINRAEQTETLSAGVGTPTTVSNSTIVRVFGSSSAGAAIEELAFFNRVITLTEIQAFEAGYLTDRYGP